MLTTLTLLTCTLAAAQGPPTPAGPYPPPVFEGRSGEWLLLPQFGRGLEFVYRGTFEEQSTSRGVQFQRTYRVQSVAHVLDAPPQGEAQVAFLTLLRAKGDNDPRLGDPAPGSVRLELARVDSLGKVSGQTCSLLAPLEGPPTLETSAYVEAPRKYLRTGDTWKATEDGRPARLWTVQGTEPVNATQCVRVVGVQKSDDWDQPRADRTAWRRQDTVWLSPKLGVAWKVERVVERREPAHRDPAYKAVLRLELDQRTEYPRGIAEDIRREIIQARAFTERAVPLLPTPARHQAQLEALIEQIRAYRGRYAAPPPYGEALAHLDRRLQAAHRGEATPLPLPAEGEQPRIAAVGRPAPDFVVQDFGSTEPARLGRWKGRPVVMVFYTPRSPTAPDVLRLGQEVCEQGKGAVAVLGMAMTSDTEAVRKQREELKLTYPQLSGLSLRQSYAVEATPRVLVLDADGIVRATVEGWGRETRTALLEGLRACQPAPSGIVPAGAVVPILPRP